MLLRCMVWILSVMCLAAAGCSTVQGVVQTEKKDERIARAQRVEPLLDAAGFKSMPLDTPQKQQVIQGLEPLRFNRLGRHQKISYWFSDPYYCKCVYVGDQLAYERYQQAKTERKQEQIEAQSTLYNEEEMEMPIDSTWDPGMFWVP